MQIDVDINEDSFEQLKATASNNGLKLIYIVDEYERLMKLRGKDNPPLKPGQKMIEKVELAKLHFIEEVKTNKFGENQMEDLVKGSTMLSPWLAQLTLELIGKDEIVLVPAKRNYMYIGQLRLINLLDNLVKHDKISNLTSSGQCLKELVDIASKADYDCQLILEFRLINILIMFLGIFTDAKESISFIAYLMKTQQEISMGH
jgi:hypothetical protein